MIKTNNLYVLLTSNVNRTSHCEITFYSMV